MEFLCSAFKKCGWKCFCKSALININPLNEFTPTEFISLFFDGLVSLAPTQPQVGSGCHHHRCHQVSLVANWAEIMPAGSLVLLHGKQWKKERMKETRVRSEWCLCGLMQIPPLHSLFICQDWHNFVPLLIASCNPIHVISSSLLSKSKVV